MNLKDVHLEFGAITKITENYVFFGEVKKLKTKINPKDIIFYYPPEIKVDWKDSQAVKAYYETFIYWCGVMRNSDCKEIQLHQVVNNMVFFEGEYYLPYYMNETPQEKKRYENCKIYGFCSKIHDGNYSYVDGKYTPSNNFHNVFYAERIVTDEEILENEMKKNNFIEMDTISYLKSLNKRRINGNDLKLFKANLKNLFDLSIFPYTTNNVTFFIDKDFGKIIFSHRNRLGFLEFDNGYHGRTPFGNDYYLILIGNPYITNESGTYSRVESNGITFDKVMLDSLANDIVPRFNRAIENNYIIYGS